MLVIELAFTLSYRVLGNPGGAIVCVSLIVSLLCLPLYRMADGLQRRERARQMDMERWVSRIRKNFRGDERYMMLSTYYREQGYKPIYALSSSFSLLLQVPIFIAAYSFLSGLDVLEGASFLLIPDLSKPDGLMSILGVGTINLMPILMTLLNCASTYVYTKDAPLRDKVQAYGLAVLFLVLLYNSPSGLVLYWTCNQIFSLVRNVYDVARQRMPQLSDVVRQRMPQLSDVVRQHLPQKRVTDTRQPSPATRAREQQGAPRQPRRRRPPYVKEFLLAAGLAAALLGLLVPSAYLGAAPLEFIIESGFAHPLSFVGYTFCVMGGLFIVWVGVFFFLARRRTRARMVCVLACLDVVLAIDYFVFGEGMGIISAHLTFESFPVFHPVAVVINLVVVALAAAAVAYVWRRNHELVSTGMGILLIATVCLALPNFVTVMGAEARAAELNKDLQTHTADRAALSDAIAYTTGGYEVTPRVVQGLGQDLPGLLDIGQAPSEMAEQQQAEDEPTPQDRASEIARSSRNPLRQIEFDDNGYPVPVLEFSRTGKNVVVLFLDRAVGAMVPYLFDERPDLYDTYDGFTYYPNTISFGGHTLFGSPALYGGYDYSVEQMQRREGEQLVDKHNEALKLLPAVMGQLGFDTVYFDPPYVNYGGNDPSTLAGDYDLTVYYSENALADFYLKHGSYAWGEVDPRLSTEASEAARAAMFRRGLVWYSFMRTAPLILREAIYDGGSYLSPSKTSIDSVVAMSAEDMEATIASAQQVDLGHVTEVAHQVLGIAKPEEGTREEPVAEPQEQPQEEPEVAPEEFAEEQELTDASSEQPDEASIQEAERQRQEEEARRKAELIEAGASRMGSVGRRTVNYVLIQWYSVLADLPYLTKAEDNAANHLYVLHNLLPHVTEVLQRPNFEPAVLLDNSAYAEPAYRVHDGRVMNVESEWYVGSFHANMSSLLRVGEWLDYLRELGVYDNTRIIIVADHGYYYGQFEDLMFDDGNGGNFYDAEESSAMLLVKDFDAHGFTVSDEFMTNADTPMLVTKDLVNNPTNPWTGNKLDSHEKYEQRQLVTTSKNWDPVDQGDTTWDLSDGAWYSVTGNSNDAANWRFEGETLDWQEWDERKSLTAPRDEQPVDGAATSGESSEMVELPE